MTTSSEYRRRAREALDGNLFGNTWLYLLLVMLVASVVLGASSAVVVGPLLLCGPISIGVASFTLHTVRRTDKKNKIDSALDGFRNSIGDHILLGFLNTIFVFLWSLLFVIPGIVKAIAYSQCYFIKIDHPEYDAQTCITESRRMMNGHKWQYFCLSFSFIGWAIVGALCCGVGSLWVQAYMQAAYAEFYEDLKKQADMVF